MQYATWRPVLGLSLIAAALASFALSSHKAPTPVLSTTAIREVWGESLMSVKVTSSVPIQDTRPIALQRGPQIDGRMHAGPSQQMAVGANPFENVWRAQSIGGINLATGAYEIQDVDISLPATVAWPIGRTYNARQETSGGSHRDSDGIQGANWFQTSHPTIVFYDDATDTKDIVYLMYGADRFAEYKRVATNGVTFKGVNGAAGVFKYVAAAGSEPETYTLHDQNGNELIFIGFDGNAHSSVGQLWKITDAAGNCAYVGDSSTPGTAIDAANSYAKGYDSSGRIKLAFDSAGHRFTYTYSTLNSVVRLTQVKAEKNSGGWVSVAQVDYSYYGNESYGDVGDLKQVTLTTPLTDSGVSLTQKALYRYYEGSYNSSTNRGYSHELQYVYDFEGVRKYDWLDTTFDDDHLTASLANLQSYASAYFEYEEDGGDDPRRITKAWFNGECGCSGGSNGTYYFEYEGSGYSNTANVYDTAWATRTIVQRPDTSYLTQYWDEVGQPLSQVITDADPDNTGPSPSRWVTRVIRDSDGFVTDIRTPANCTGYTHSNGTISSSSSVGLVWEFARGSNAFTGFVTAKKYREAGTGGTLYYDSQLAYGQNDKVIVAFPTTGYTEVIRPAINSQTRYPQKTSSPSGTYENAHTLTWDSTTKLWLTTDLVTEPVITTGNNGSNSANTYTRYFKSDGRPFYEKARDGILSYRAYTDGQVTTTIEDADTSILSDEPAGLSSTGSPFHRVTTYAYDNQGRIDTVTAPDGHVTKHYYSKDGQARLVDLVYADYEVTPKFYGPVQYTVRNQAGNVEVQATVGLASNESTTALTGHVDETDADPITAMDLGTVVRMSTQIYNETGGTVQESRLYFEIPASGAGSDGTNYDATTFGYDDSGRKVRVKDPSGTVTHTVLDKLGRTTGRFVGMNDYGFTAGDVSGPETMVQTEALEYDGGADNGNGYITERTLFVVDGSTDQRVTTYANDSFGRVLLQTNPTAPHALNKYDNEGQLTATGLYSSTSNITVGTTDPAGTGTNTDRMALTRSYYDEVGQLWKSARYKIDASDGSDDDSLLHTYWRDAAGRVIKEDGPQLTKTFYDRLGRTTRRFVLAEDNDSTYSNMDDVSGDYVLEEDQAVYESGTSDDVLMSVRLDRKHDDFGGISPTTGALDTDADGLALKLTSSNIKGRAQITCSWYDRFGRVTDEVQYGTYGGSTFDRTGLSVPSRSDTALVTSFSYDPYLVYTSTTDPRGLVARREVDDAGHAVKEIKNYDVAVNSGDPANPDDNQTVKYEFVDGLRTKIIADMPSGETDQETVYIYGTLAGTPSAQVLTTGNQLRAVKYPDTTNTGTTSANINSDSSDVVSYAYNAQGQVLYQKDQAPNVFESVFDDSGRELHRRVTTLASGFDNAVLRISRTNDSLGRPSLVTQYDNATVGSGSVTDEVSYTYDGWGGITSYKQDKDSAIGGSGYYEMAYTYEKALGGRNTMRRDTMTLPGGFVVTITYGNDKDDSISRVSRLKDGATTLVKYNYLGAGRVVGSTYQEPNIARTEYVTSSDSYTGHLDNFNRVVNSCWWTLAPNPDKKFYDCDVSYDRNSNITWVEDNVHAGFDVKYTMDDLDRLIDAEEGTRSSGSIASRTRHQTWLQSSTSQLGHTGNWKRSKLDLDGDDNWNEASEYDDTRTHNTVNELTARDTDTNGSNNFTLAYDGAGDMTDDGESYKYEYDAFYRLRMVKNQSSTLLAEYRYNGLGHMIGVHEDTDTDGDADSSDKWFYPAYDEAWREVARYRESDTSPKEQFVNATAGLDGYGRSSYINDVVCRNRDANTAWTAASDGTLEERYYLCQNWRGDVSALVSSARQLHEMDKYSAYGIPFGLPGGDTNSDGDNDAADATQIQTWINGSAYDARGDVDLDGDVDSTDKALAQGTPINGNALAWRTLSDDSLSNRRSISGCDHASVGDLAIIRRRQYSAALGRWEQRDPAAFASMPNLYQFCVSSPVDNTDPTGLVACPGQVGPVNIPVNGSACGAGHNLASALADAVSKCKANAVLTNPTLLMLLGLSCTGEPCESQGGICLRPPRTVDTSAVESTVGTPGGKPGGARSLCVSCSGDVTFELICFCYNITDDPNPVGPPKLGLHSASRAYARCGAPSTR